MANSAFEIIFKIGDGYYLAGTVRASHEKVELFFHFPWGSRQKSKYQEIGKNTIEHGCLPDHVSFHSDGSIHEKYQDYKKRKKYINKLKPGINVFNLSLGKFLPIYIESIRLSEETKSKRLKLIPDPTEYQQQKSWDVSKFEYVSIVLISKCAGVNPANLLSDHGFQSLTKIGKIPILANIFKVNDKTQLPEGSKSQFDTQLLLMIVQETWPEQEPKLIESKNDKYVLLCNSVTLPPMEIISKMINLNDKC